MGDIPRWHVSALHDVFRCCLVVGVLVIAAHREVSGILREQLNAIKAEYDRVMSRDVAAFNAMLQQRGIPNLISN